jgi:hypothetical protein
VDLIELHLQLRKARELNPELLLDLTELIVDQREDIFAAGWWSRRPALARLPTFASLTTLSLYAALSNGLALATVSLVASGFALD